MTKLSLDEFLLLEFAPNPVRSIPLDFDSSSNDIITTLITDLYNHVGIYLLDGVSYDSFLFTGTDNIYFSVEFNPITGSALRETLLILSVLSIEKTDDNTYTLTEKSGFIHTLILESFNGKEF